MNGRCHVRSCRNSRNMPRGGCLVSIMVYSRPRRDYCILGSRHALFCYMDPMTALIAEIFRQLPPTLATVCKQRTYETENSHLHDPSMEILKS